jgi:hypothetical protein
MNALNEIVDTSDRPAVAPSNRNAMRLKWHRHREVLAEIARIVGGHELSSVAILSRWCASHVGQLWLVPNISGSLTEIDAKRIGQYLSAAKGWESRRGGNGPKIWRIKTNRPWRWRPGMALLDHGMVNPWLDFVLKHIHITGPAMVRHLAEELGGEYATYSSVQFGHCLGRDPRFTVAKDFYTQSGYTKVWWVSDVGREWITSTTDLVGSEDE